VEFKPILLRRASDEAVSQIAEAIRIGDVRPGDRLPSERELAAQLRISRPTVREALRILIDERIVETRPGANGGAVVVTDVVPRRLLDDRFQLRESEVSGVLEARRLVEPRVAQLAAVNAEEDDFEAMARTIGREADLVSAGLGSDAAELFLQLDLQFHLLIARASRNSTVVRLTHNLFRDLELARNIAMREPSTPDWVIDIHERTLAAIRSRNLELVDAVMDEHLSVLERTWEHVSGRALIRPIPEFLKPLLPVR
jgi:GntR family transcriptional regulator, transcriptional repressor for pyruvate dehydrogenase complex